MDSVQQLIWWLFQSSAGGPTRVRVVRALKERPRNAQQLSAALGLDYTTVRHHLRVLQRNHLVEVAGEHYGQVYFVSGALESRWSMLDTLAVGSPGRRPGGDHDRG